MGYYVRYGKPGDFRYQRYPSLRGAITGARGIRRNFAQAGLSVTVDILYFT